MKCREVIKYLENWAPRAIAWDKDNTGLQVGNSSVKIKNIMLSLEINEKVLNQALNKDCNFIITHHPLLFRSLKKIDTENGPVAKLVEMLIKNDITLYSAHTNLDFTKEGVSFTLAKKIGLQNIRFLKNLNENKLKLVVFVPEDSVNKVAEAIHNAGGGVIGNYSNCSFRIEGRGTFMGSSDSNPALGKKENLEGVDEIRLEVLIDHWNADTIISKMISAHPYEEVAYDVYPLLNENPDYGMGAIGELKQPMKKNGFLSHVCNSLATNNLRYSNGKNQNIKKVAVCGGSCSELLETAIAEGADVFITSDIKYHAFQDAENRILFIDAGHYETEIHSLKEIKKRLTHFVNNRSDINIFIYSGSTNPVIFYNN